MDILTADLTLSKHYLSKAFLTLLQITITVNLEHYLFYSFMIDTVGSLYESNISGPILRELSFAFDPNDYKIDWVEKF